MKLVQKILISLTIAFFAVCCGAVLLFNWQVTGWKALTVPTGSMRPTIPPGSLVLMHSVPVASLKVGDVITYTNPLTMKSTITHRIIKAYKIDGKIPAFITKGDANKTADVQVVGGLVKGKAVWHMPYVGGWLAWTKKPIGLLALVYIPALLLMFEEVQRLNEYYRRSKPYLAAQKLVLKTKERRKKLAPASAAISLILVLAPIVIAFPAQALLRSNTVSLVNNRISVAALAPPTQCMGNNSNTTVTVNSNSSSTNTVTVNNSSSQSSSTGNSTVTGNTTGGSATSGNASNSNCTTTIIDIH